MPVLSGRYTTRDKMIDAGGADSGAAPASSPDDILDTPEAATYLRLSVSSLNKMRCTGSGPPFIRMGRAVRYRRRALDLFLDSRCTTSTTDADCRLPTRLSESLVTTLESTGAEERTRVRSLPNNGQAPSRTPIKGAASKRGARGAVGAVAVRCMAGEVSCSVTATMAVCW
jgi:predicted DNA-binding transcriptional regulator AlpA